MKLTETQKAIVIPLIQNYNKAKIDLETALVLIVGRKFKNYTINGNELIFEEIEEKE